MTTVAMEKVATIIREIGKGRTSVYSLRYRELETELANDRQITVTYAFGRIKERRAQLTKLGFRLVETVFWNDNAPHAQIREVWGR